MVSITWMALNWRLAHLQRLIPRSRLLAQGEATQKNVKALRSPAVLHIVGHGLVRGNEDCGTRMRAGQPGSRIASHESFGHRS